MKFSFINIIVIICSSLPTAVVDVDCIDLLKSRLDNFWMSQDVKYDCTVNLASIPEIDWRMTLKVFEKL